ncbi:putative MAPEG superfamily protein related to glutathione S-transferase [Rivularia sp. PCC 7116]|uniref:MAPEG family protein n=1 Tax=Rivularia sp. PCC 7116 TaxID=373994 RepID=UPI00029EFCCF|nr:MAPEG family protein [Rivularia sp. PCC 7116]AFY56907.1 putative MAPEG superfamily protein related to glutathione S-transferase [Rivularia sp. PCC 7116]
MNFPVIAAGCASILALLQVFLAGLVGFARFKHKVGIGDGGNEVLARKIRVHGNLIENAPIFLILLALLELSGIDKTTVAILGGVFILARISHAYALSRTTNPLTPLRFPL